MMIKKMVVSQKWLIKLCDVGPKGTFLKPHIYLLPCSASVTL